ncbi:MAG TPA: copper chaperone PCu(A)C [Acidiphilium sp.]
MIRALLMSCALLAPGLAQAAPAVTVQGAWFRYLLPQVPAGGFMTLVNHANTDAVLTGAKSSACGSAMLHESTTKSGMDMMMTVNSVTIPAHGTFRFAPGGYHVMCMKPDMKVGSTATVQLLFRNAPPLDVTFRVYGADGKPGA